MLFYDKVFCLELQKGCLVVIVINFVFGIMAGLLLWHFINDISIIDNICSLAIVIVGVCGTYMNNEKALLLPMIEELLKIIYAPAWFKSHELIFSNLFQLELNIEKNTSDVLIYVLYVLVNLAMVKGIFSVLVYVSCFNHLSDSKNAVREREIKCPNNSEFNKGIACQSKENTQDTSTNELVSSSVSDIPNSEENKGIASRRNENIENGSRSDSVSTWVSTVYLDIPKGK